MSNSIQPLLSTEHKDHGWKRSDNYGYATRDAWAPLLLAELPAALPLYPLAFAALPQGGFALGVLQGLHDCENLLLDANGRWQTGYVPSFYRSYPFVLAKVENDPQNRTLLCFDHASSLYREAPNAGASEEFFFDVEGKPRHLLAQVIQFLNATHSNRVLTGQAVQAIAEAGLLEPWVWGFENPDPERPMVRGLYRINQAALHGLAADTVKKLLDVNALAIVYAQLFSMPRVALLRSLYAKMHPAVTMPQSISALFGESADDTLNIDWNLLAQSLQKDEEGN